ncbi:S1 domain-containing protein [Actinomadura sediminis]|uniref:Cold shock domain-containing protein n=1 Tax=Actinomadura sediminis TaxID=1038904 RepID=A0ABW3F004_9ACTN
MMPSGRILRFDGIRGRGLIAPEEGGAPLPLRAEDLRHEKYHFAPGTRVHYELVHDGDRPRASNVTLADAEATLYLLPTDPERAPDQGVMSRAEFLTEVTELIITSAPTLNAEQIVELRARLTRFAQARRWVGP